MKLKAIKKYNLFIAFLITVLGFGSSCKDKEISAAYGTPSQRFRVYGNITSEIGSRIPGIKVMMTSEYILSATDTTIYLRDTASTITDYYGYYDVGLYNHWPIKDFKIEFIDVDGIALRKFHKKDTTVNFINPVFENGKGWYQGEASKELNIQMKEEL